MRTRNLLHKNKLRPFILFAESLGYVKDLCKGDYEVLRMKGPNGTAIIHQRLDRGDHFTTHGLSTELVSHFIKNQRLSS